jgi:hypothetical protein
MAEHRICAAPVLLAITAYERHTADMPGSTFYDRVSHAADKVIDSLPRRLRRMSELRFAVVRLTCLTPS